GMQQYKATRVNVEWILLLLSEDAPFELADGAAWNPTVQRGVVRALIEYAGDGVGVVLRNLLVLNVGNRPRTQGKRAVQGDASRFDVDGSVSKRDFLRRWGRVRTGRSEQRIQ